MKPQKNKRNLMHSYVTPVYRYFRFNLAKAFEFLIEEQPSSEYVYVLNSVPPIISHIS